MTYHKRYNFDQWTRGLHPAVMTPHPTTILLLAHPQFAASRANAALLKGLADMPGLEIAALYSLYADGLIDAEAERARLLRADRLVLQFPLQWYSTPALLKYWLDAVLTPLFYMEPEVAAATAGLPLLAATTTGGPLSSYCVGGSALPITELFAPLRATALKCHWRWQPPFAVHDVRNLDAAALEGAAGEYRTAVWCMPTIRPHAASAA